MDWTKARLVIAVAMLLASCGGPRAITVASKNFTEQVLLGEIIAQHLENRMHAKVERKLNLGGTLVAHQAITSGSIDVYPEYTGTALTAVLKQPAGKESGQVWETVAAAYKKWNIEWIPLGFNNSFAMAVRSDEPQLQAYRTLSEAAKRQDGWTLGVGYEFVTRPDGLAGLLSTYGLKLKGSPREMDLGLLYSALGQKQVEMAAVSATDGLIDAMHLRILEDDQHYFPPYDAAILNRRADLQPALMELKNRLSEAAMRRMNYEVDGKHRPVADVAREFLANAPAK